MIMNTFPLISVIVPVYNAEQLIRRCIDSLLSQTYAHFEVILVDDGSPDRCGKICDEYAEKDSRIRVIHQKNGGVSVARQTGLEAAQGEYVIHVDPDDWVDNTMLEELLAKAFEKDADMVFCDYYEEHNNGSFYISQDPKGEITSENILKKILFQQLHGSCCNKLVKRVCYNGIGFYPSHLCILEDELFNTRILARGIKVDYLPQAFYHYCTNNEVSLCHSVSDKSLQSKMDAITEIENILKADSRIQADDFYAIKKNVLFDALRTKRFKQLSSIYPEIHSHLIQDGKRYRWYTPQTCCLSIALRGYPGFAHCLYHCNTWLIHISQKIKNLIN